MRKKLITLAVSVVIAVSLSACGHNNFRDVEGVKSNNPDYIENYNNMDKHPNIGLVCIHDVGFATTTRDYTAIMRVPEWDSICKAHAK